MSEYETLFKINKDYPEILDHFLFMLNAPQKYGGEDEMLKYLKDNPEATLSELLEHFDEIVPYGTLPVGDDGSDLLEDD